MTQNNDKRLPEVAAVWITQKGCESQSYTNKYCFNNSPRTGVTLLSFFNPGLTVQKFRMEFVGINFASADLFSVSPPVRGIFLVWIMTPFAWSSRSSPSSQSQSTPIHSGPEISPWFRIPITEVNSIAWPDSYSLAWNSNGKLNYSAECKIIKDFSVDASACFSGNKNCVFPWFNSEKLILSTPKVISSFAPQVLNTCLLMKLTTIVHVIVVS